MRKFLHFLAVVGLVIAGIIALVSLFAFVFLKTWKPFGGKAGKTDRKNSWSKNCDADSLGCDYSFTARLGRAGEVCFYLIPLIMELSLLRM